MTPTKLYNKEHDSYCTWNGTAYENDGKIAGAYFYGLEKAKNNGFEPIISSAEELDELMDEIFEESTNVKFYMATYEPNESDEQPYREVVAVFVDEEENSKFGDKCFSCYAHLGQHSTCSQSFLAENCKEITDQEVYLELYNELLNLGYNLNVV
jgi:hypothetical protein